MLSNCGDGTTAIGTRWPGEGRRQGGRICRGRRLLGDWTTEVAVVLGAVVSIITSLVAKLWIEPIGERREEKRRKAEAEDQLVRAFQADVLELAVRLTRLGAELSIPWWIALRRIGEIQQAYEEFAAFSIRVTRASTSLVDEDARAVAVRLREATLPLVAGRNDVLKEEAMAFIAKLREASDEIGAIIRKRAE